VQRLPLVQAPRNGNAHFPGHKPSAIFPGGLLLAARGNPRVERSTASSGSTSWARACGKWHWRGLWLLTIIYFALAVISACCATIKKPRSATINHASHGGTCFADATPVKPEAAGGGGLKGQALRAQRRAGQLEVRCNLDLIGHFLPGHLIVAQAAPLIVALHPLLSSSGGMSMASRRPSRILVLGLILIAAGIGGYFLWRPRPVAPIAGGLSRLSPRKAPFGKPAFQPY
jgi:hypothetical protein